MNSLFETTCVYDANLQAVREGYRYIVNQGGSWSSKTISILQAAFTLACEEKCTITVTAESVPFIKKGPLQDAKNIVDASPLLQQFITAYNATDRVYTFLTGSKIEFASFPSVQSAHGPKRDYLFVNEAPGIAYNIFDQLEQRTRKAIFIDYNPYVSFWVHEKVLIRNGVKKIRSWYEHNPFVPDTVKDRLQGLEFADYESFKVYGRGLTGKLKGTIFNFNVVDDLPRDDKGKVLGNCLGSGLDFGFINDVSALTDVYLYSGELYLDERLYQIGLLNVPVAGATFQQPNISDKLKEMNFPKGQEIVGDSAEQKSISELRVAGWRMLAADKFPGSIIYGINLMLKYKINITRRSTNVIKEFQKYRWKTDKNGNTLNEPIDFENHAIDGVRYLISKKLKHPSLKASDIMR